MALTRRFFANLAADYRAIRPPESMTGSRQVWAEMVRITAGALAAQNAMFNYERFYEACGMDAG